MLCYFQKPGILLLYLVKSPINNTTYIIMFYNFFCYVRDLNDFVNYLFHDLQITWNSQHT